MLRQCDKLLPSIILENYDCVTNTMLIELAFLILDWWFLSVSLIAWAKEIGSEIYEESLITSFNLDLRKVELLFN